MAIKTSAVRNANTRVDEILGTLPVTDRVFYDLRDTQPLVEQLVATVREIRRSGRVLIIAPNALLAHALIDLGYHVDLWQVPQGTLTDDLMEHIRRRQPLDELLARPGERAHDIVIVPFVLEAAAKPPPATLDRLRQALKRDGRLVIVYRQAGALGDRISAIRGRSPIGDPSLAPPGISLSWPALGRHRAFGADELRAWCRMLNLRVERSVPVLDRHAAVPVRAMPLLAWLAAEFAHGIKLAMPSLRDTVVATVATLPSASPLQKGSGKGSRPRVTVVVSSRDQKRLERVVNALSQQSYGAGHLDVIVLRAPGTTSAAPSHRGLRVRVIESACPDGPVAANLALRQSTAAIIVFTDDLCRLPAGWIEAGVSALESGAAAAAGLINVDGDSEGPFLELPAARPLTADEGIFPAANAFYLRRAALEVGGFDERFEANGRARWGWETQLGSRLQDHGYAARFEETAYVFRQFPFRPRRLWIVDEYRRARDIPSGVRRSPALRRLLVHGIFASPRTMAFDLMLAGIGVAVLRRRARYLLLAIPFAKRASRYFDLWPPAAWKPSMRHVRGIGARHAVWLAGFLVGSIKARRIVL